MNGKKFLTFNERNCITLVKAEKEIYHQLIFCADKVGKFLEMSKKDAQEELESWDQKY